MDFGVADAAQEVANYLKRSTPPEATVMPGVMFIVGNRHILVFVADDGKLALLDFDDAEPIVAQATNTKQIVN